MTWIDELIELGNLPAEQRSKKCEVKKVLRRAQSFVPGFCLLQQFLAFRGSEGILIFCLPAFFPNRLPLLFLYTNLSLLMRPGILGGGSRREAAWKTKCKGSLFAFLDKKMYTWLTSKNQHYNSNNTQFGIFPPSIGNKPASQDVASEKMYVLKYSRLIQSTKFEMFIPRLGTSCRLSSYLVFHPRIWLSSQKDYYFLLCIMWWLLQYNHS